MRADGEGRKQKMQTTRVVGIGMMLGGILAFSFAVAGMSGAGATNVAKPAHQVCEVNTHGHPMGQVAGAINQGCNETTTTFDEQCGCTTTTTVHECECSTTTTYPDTTTSTEVAGTTIVVSTTAATTTSTTAATTTTSTTVPEVTTTTEDTTFGTRVVATTTTLHKTVAVGGITSTLPSQIQTAPTTGVLPFTGGSPIPLAGLGLVLVGTGAGLSRRKRRLA
jgi:hypothetical protein